jgi:mRNA interferase MazF
MTSKQRPAVVVSSHSYAQQRPDVVVMAITSQVRSSHMSMSFADTLLRDWDKANLLKPSVVKPILATLEQGLVIKQLGQLSASDQIALHRTLQEVIG